MSDAILGANEVAVYLRTSMQYGQTVETQLIPIQKYCDAHGLKFQVFAEQESSRNTRPVKEDLLQRARRGEFKTILVWRFDRWARSLPELVMNLQELTDAGVNFISITEGIDLKTSTGKLMLGIIGSFAQFERDLIRERTLAGLDRARAEGKKLGRPKGSADKKVRRKSGYHLRYAKKGN